MLRVSVRASVRGKTRVGVMIMSRVEVQVRIGVNSS